MLLPAGPVRNPDPPGRRPLASQHGWNPGPFCGPSHILSLVYDINSLHFCLNGTIYGGRLAVQRSPDFPATLGYLANMIKRDFASTCAHICQYNLGFLCTRCNILFFLSPDSRKKGTLHRSRHSHEGYGFVLCRYFIFFFFPYSYQTLW